MSAASPPRVTICLPTIGRLTYMRETLDSVKAQELQAYELLILYNGGDTAVLERLEAFAREHPDARVLAEGSSMPMFANFNRGLKVARGDYVTFFHDDDTYEPGFLKRMVEEMDAHPRTAFAGSNYFITDENSVVTGHRRLIKRTRVQPGHDFIRELMSRGRGAIPTPGIVFRKSAFDDRGWDEKLSMHFGDFVVLMQMAETWDAMLIAEPLMRVRLHGKNASNVAMSSAAPMLHGALMQYVEDFQKRWPLLRDVARDLQSSAHRTLRRFLIWGWISADDDAEAARCTELMRSHGHSLLASLLDGLAAVGVAASRRKGIAAGIRRLGRVSG